MRSIAHYWGISFIVDDSRLEEALSILQTPPQMFLCKVRKVNRAVVSGGEIPNSELVWH